ncbi:MAG: hypothetical protein JWM49_1053 [Microbacteriaceae bacterium]|nr:hypothetical protein [Microbacteriaceae bacterium]
MTEVSEAVVLGEDGRSRCVWSAKDEEYRRYHDEEWGAPLHGDRALFEKLSLEGFQAGLSWITILRRRDRFRAVFHDFDIDRVAQMGPNDVEQLMLDPTIIRNRAKLEAVLSNARIVRRLVAESPGALDTLLWSFAPPPQSRPRPSRFGDLPAVTPESTAMSKHLRGLGFTFVGPTTLYALMQSAGMVDDHFEGCWRAA